MARFGTEAVSGLREARNAFKAIPIISADELNKATDATAEALLAAAKANLRPGHGFDTGQLQKALGLTKATKLGVARVGIRRGFDLIIPGTGGSALTRKGARKHSPTKIGHLVEFGHGGPRPARAYPFMMPATEGQREPYLQRVRAAGKRIEQIMASKHGGANVGGRFH